MNKTILPRRTRAAGFSLARTLAWLTAAGLVAVATLGPNAGPARAATPTSASTTDLKGSAAGFANVLVDGAPGTQADTVLSCHAGAAARFASELSFDLAATTPAGAFFRLYLAPNGGAKLSPSGVDITSNGSIVSVAGLAAGHHVLPVTLDVKTSFSISAGGVLLVIADDATGAEFHSKSNSLNCTEAAVDPSSGPTEAGVQPSTQPSSDPSMDPSAEPSADPSVEPSFDPSTDPSIDPSADPSVEPSIEPVLGASVEPSIDAGANPSTDPSGDSGEAPIANPSIDPSTGPFDRGTDPVDPAGQPSDGASDPTTADPGDPATGGDPTTADPSSDPGTLPAGDTGGETVAVPDPTASPAQTESVLSATGRPAITPPPTDTLADAARGSTEGWRLALIGLASIILAVLLLAPRPRRNFRVD